MIATSSPTASTRTSGSGLAIANTTGLAAIVRTASSETAPGPETPTRTSAPASTSLAMPRSPAGFVRTALAARTNPAGERGMANDVLAGADVLVGVSGPGAVSEDAVRTMAARPVVFAMANPEPEVRVEAVGGDVAIMATGRSDYPNQINNVLAFPGVFRS